MLLSAGTRRLGGRCTKQTLMRCHRHTYQLGDNSEAALLAGWNNAAMKVLSYKHPQATILSLSTKTRSVAC